MFSFVSELSHAPHAAAMITFEKLFFFFTFEALHLFAKSGTLNLSSFPNFVDLYT